MIIQGDFIIFLFCVYTMTIGACIQSSRTVKHVDVWTIVCASLT